MEIPFPGSKNVWDAPEPRQWQLAMSNAASLPTFRDALRDLAGRGLIRDDASLDMRWILLHGLISVSWTLLWRDLGDLSMVGDSKITQWKESLKKGFTVWTQREEQALSLGTDVAVHQAGMAFGHLGG